jgi:hypothetical protein
MMFRTNVFGTPDRPREHVAGLAEGETQVAGDEQPVLDQSSLATTGVALDAVRGPFLRFSISRK